MGNNKGYKFTDLEITSAKLPQNTHLIWEISSSLMFLVAQDDPPTNYQTKLYKSVDKGDNWTLVTTRDHKIQSGWNDGTYIWLVDCDNDGTADDFDVWKITVDGNDTITSIGTSAGAELNSVYTGDIFKIGTDVFVSNYEVRGANKQLVVWDVDTAPFTEKDTAIVSYTGSTEFFKGVVTGTIFYDVLDIPSLGDIYAIVYDNSVPSLLFKVNQLENYGIPTNESQTGTSYDDSNFIYFVAKKTADNKNYLVTYSITGDSFTVYSEYDIALMLDRNCVNTAPNEYEKAFDVAKDANNNSRIWEIKPKKEGIIQLQTINRNSNIVAITDNYLIFADGSVYEYTDIMATQTIAEGIINKGTFPLLEKGRFNCHPDDAILFYNDDTLKVYDDTDEMVLFAKITDKSQDENGIYQFGLDAYTNELWRRAYSKSHSANKSSDKVKDNVDNACGFCHRSSSIDSTDATNYSYEQDRPPMSILALDRFMERKVGYAQPNGLVWTKPYDGLAKAPQYYTGTYNFRDDDVGSFPDGWTDNDGVGCETTVIASLDGHKKVMQQYDNGAGNCNAYISITQGLNTTIEFWHAKSSIAANTSTYLYIDEGATNILVLRWEDDDLDYYDGAWKSVKDNFLIANKLSRFKLVLNDAANTYDIYIDEVLEKADAAYRNNSISGIDKISTRTDSDDTGYKGYFAAIGISTDPNYNVGDNVVAWDVEINGKLDLINIDRNKPSYYVKKLGITRATCVGTVGISQTYSDASLEDGKIIIPLKEYRDLKIQAITEALQIATALFNIFSAETKFIGLRVVNQEFIQPGKTVNFANTGDITVAESDYLVLFYAYDFVNDVYDLMILTDNIVTLSEFESYFDRSALMVHQNSTAVRENATGVATNATDVATKGNCNIKTDTYTGTGANNRQITGFGFTPKFVVISNDSGQLHFFNDQMTAWKTNSHYSTSASLESNIAKIIADGIELNNNHAMNRANINTVVYRYTAWG